MENRDTPQINALLLPRHFLRTAAKMAEMAPRAAPAGRGVPDPLGTGVGIPPGVVEAEAKRSPRSPDPRARQPSEFWSYLKRATGRLAKMV